MFHVSKYQYEKKGGKGNDIKTTPVVLREATLLWM